MSAVLIKAPVAMPTADSKNNEVIFKSERNVQVNDQKLVKITQIEFDKEVLLMFIHFM